MIQFLFKEILEAEDGKILKLELRSPLQARLGLKKATSFLFTTRGLQERDLGSLAQGRGAHSLAIALRYACADKDADEQTDQTWQPSPI